MTEKTSKETGKDISSNIVKRTIEEEMKQSYLDYSMSVIVGRALPDARDGLKPVHRRILYTMHRAGLLHNRPFRKSAFIVGRTMSDFHPHGDSAIYDSLVRLAQDFSMRYPIVDGQGNFGCFTKETQVRLCDGRNLNFGDLIEEHKQGKRNFTFTIKENGDVSLAEIKNPRLTKHNASLVKVTLDNGQEIKCTPDHRFMLLDGSYCQAKKLNAGVSLMPGYFRFTQKDESPHTADYELVYQPRKKTWDYCHQLADLWNLEAQNYSKITGRVRHHIDFNKYNNNPTNITRMHWGAHIKLHADHAAQWHKSDEYRKKIAAGRTLFWSNSEHKRQYAQRISQKNKVQWQNPEYRNHMRKVLSRVNKEYIENHPEKREEFSKRASNTLKRLWKDPIYRKLFNEKIIASNKKRETNLTGKAKFLRICQETLAQYQTLDANSYEATREARFGKGFTTWQKGLQKYFDNDVNSLYSEVCENHKVISVEHLPERSDVYDLTIDTTHNFLLAAGVFVHNSVDGDNAAAMRYTESRLKKLAEELMQDIDKRTVHFVPNFDNTSQEPEVLPAKAPNLLINGSSGIAVGMATNIPPHNLSEIVDATISFIDNPAVSLQQLMQHVKGPDFPTGALICGSNGIMSAYKTGKGKIILRAKILQEKDQLVVNEIPYMVNKSEMISQIADLVRDKKIIGISDIRDESDRDGIRIVIELKKDANPEVLINQLYVHSRLQVTFGITMVALVNSIPKLLNLSDLIGQYVGHRKDIVKKRTMFDLNKAQQRAHILEGLIIALRSIDRIIQTIKESKAVEEAKQRLTQTFKLTEEQSTAILDLRLQRLTSLEQDKIKQEHKELLQLIEELKSILSSPQKILEIIKKELLELKNEYGDQRKTMILDEEMSDLEMEDIVEESECVITISHSGYVKRTPLDVYRSQNRGGKGLVATTTKEEDFVEDIFIANTHSYMLFFTNKGKIHWLKGFYVPEAGRQAQGKAIVNLLELEDGERVTAYLPIRSFEPDKFLIMATRNGTVKKTSLEAYSRPRKGGIVSITLDGNDELISVRLTDGMKQIILATKQGIATRFNETDVRATGRSAQGVRGIRLDDKDEVIGMVVAEDDKTLLTVTEHGYGKRTAVSEYRLINRGGSGVRNIICSERNGSVVAIQSVTDGDEVMLISRKGITIRTAVSQISVIGRNTQGVRIMRLESDDKIVSVANIVD